MNHLSVTSTNQINSQWQSGDKSTSLNLFLCFSMRHTAQFWWNWCYRSIYANLRSPKWPAASLAGCHPYIEPVAAGSFCICSLYSWQQLSSIGGSFHTNSSITFRWWTSDFLFWPGHSVLEISSRRWRRRTDWLTAAGLWSDWAGTDTCWCHYTTDFCLGGSPCCERHVLLCHSSGWKRSVA